MISGLFSLPLAPADAAVAAPRASGFGAADQFIAGPENALVRSLAAAVVAEPLEYNPLVLLGPVGVGKTCLAHALAARRREALGLSSVIETTGADLARALANAIDNDSVADLRAKYHRCDLLLLDDAERLAAKAAAQQFLLTTLDALLRRGSLVIVTLKSALAGQTAASGLSPALASRLTGGLTVPLAAPGPLARRELVRQFAAHVNLIVNDELATQLAADTSSQSRLLTAARLRHIVMQLAALAEQNHGRIKSSQVARLLAEESPPTKAICRTVIATTAKHFGLTLADLRGKSRQQTVAEARGVAMYLARELSGASYAEIGRQFGSRDHTTVLHACRKVAALIEGDESVRRLAQELSAQVSTGIGN